jgi:hypothetical protein
MSRSEPRRLHLRRETVRELVHEDLGAAAGGQTPRTFTDCPLTDTLTLAPSACRCPTGITDASCYRTCTC